MLPISVSHQLHQYPQCCIHRSLKRQRPLIISRMPSLQISRFAVQQYHHINPLLLTQLIIILYIKYPS